MSTPTVGSDGPAPLDLRQQIIDQLGGWRGMTESAVPVAVFVLVNVITTLRIALYAAVAAAVLISVVRLVARKPIRFALNGLLGVVVAAGLAARTGRAQDFYLPGILLAGGYLLAGLISVVVRWPLVGVIWGFLDGSGSSWRADPRRRRTYTWLTLMWAGVFGLRVLVLGGLYLTGHVNALGVGKLVLGYPLFGLGLLVTLTVGRRMRPADMVEADMDAGQPDSGGGATGDDGLPPSSAAGQQRQPVRPETS